MQNTERKSISLCGLLEKEGPQSKIRCKALQPTTICTEERIPSLKGEEIDKFAKNCIKINKC